MSSSTANIFKEFHKHICRIDQVIIQDKEQLLLMTTVCIYIIYIYNYIYIYTCRYTCIYVYTCIYIYISDIFVRRIIFVLITILFLRHNFYYYSDFYSSIIFVLITIPFFINNFYFYSSKIISISILFSFFKNNFYFLFQLVLKISSRNNLYLIFILFRIYIYNMVTICYTAIAVPLLDQDLLYA